MTEKKICTLCGQESSELCKIAEDLIIKVILLEHPEWVKEDGSCPKCLEHYQDKIETDKA